MTIVEDRPEVASVGEDFQCIFHNDGYPDPKDKTRQVPSPRCWGQCMPCHVHYTTHQACQGET